MGKLVRDKIPDLIRAEGRIPNVMELTNEQLRISLPLKLIEEALEFGNADTREQRLEELADCLEVIHALAKLSGVLFNDVGAFCRAKHATHGGFEGGTYLRGVHDG